MPRPRHYLLGAVTAAATVSVSLPAALAATVPSAPASCSAAAVAGGYQVSWTAPTDTGGSPVTAYKVREQGYSTPVVLASGSDRTVLWTATIRDTADIRFAVRAVNAAGTSAACKTAAVVTTDPTPTPTPDPAPSGSTASMLPYEPGSYITSRVDGAGVPIDAQRTTSFRSFMHTNPDQKDISWPKINMNANWAMSYHVGKASDPIWRLKGGNTDNARLKILTTQGFHMADSVADSFPTGTQDRPGVIIDPVFGYTLQFADAVPDKATRTITVSNAGIMWHGSNGLDYRNPASDDNRNFTSRGRLIDAMVIRRDILDRAVTNGTGLGHVLHLFFVETNSADGFASPMVGAESGQAGWGAEGERIRLDPSVDLAARGLSGACLAVARTLQENGAYIGDNSGSSTQIKASQAGAYVGTNLSTDCMKGKVTWDDFQVVKRGWTG